MDWFHGSRRTSLVIAAITAVLTLSSAIACDWTYYLNVQGVPVESLFDNPAEYVQQLTRKAENRKAWDKPIAEAEQKWRETNDFKWGSDYAVCLMHTNEPARAVEILEAIEQEHPGEYVIAANLGTAYELSGDNEKALEWIRQGINRNSNAHNGSEWLHVKILEAKLELAEDPTWLQSHSVLAIPFGLGSRPVRPEEPLDLGIGQTLSLEGVQQAIEYQLGERLGFVSAPDAIVADLLFDLGNITAFTEGVKIAGAVYDKAIAFEPAQESLVRERRALMGEMSLVGKTAVEEDRKNRSDAESTQGEHRQVSGGLMRPVLLLLSLCAAVAIFVRVRARAASLRP